MAVNCCCQPTLCQIDDREVEKFFSHEIVALHLPNIYTKIQIKMLTLFYKNIALKFLTPIQSDRSKKKNRVPSSFKKLNTPSDAYFHAISKNMEIFCRIGPFQELQPIKNHSRSIMCLKFHCDCHRVCIYRWQEKPRRERTH